MSDAAQNERAGPGNLAELAAGVEGLHGADAHEGRIAAAGVEQEARVARARFGVDAAQAVQEAADGVEGWQRERHGVPGESRVQLRRGQTQQLRKAGIECDSDTVLRIWCQVDAYEAV